MNTEKMEQKPKIDWRSIVLKMLAHKRFINKVLDRYWDEPEKRSAIFKRVGIKFASIQKTKSPLSSRAFFLSE